LAQPTCRLKHNFFNPTSHFLFELGAEKTEPIYMSSTPTPPLPENHAASYVNSPIRVTNEAQLDWHDSADVVIVGYGGAGACAALEAAHNGASVLALDRFEGGGATLLSGGIIYGGDTPYQKAAGIEDSADEMYKYLRHEIGDAVREKTLRRFCETSAENFAWLCSHGIEFGSRFFKGKRSYPPPHHDLYYSGNEAAPSFKNIAKAAARGHRVASDEGYSGKDFFLHLDRAARADGVRLNTHTTVTRLIIDASERVIGVEVKTIPNNSNARKKHLKLMQRVNKWQRFLEKSWTKTSIRARELEQQYGQIRYIKANQAVVLTTGSFSFNRDMLRHYAPNYYDGMSLGTISCDGSGIVLGQSVGAEVGYMDSVTSWRTISPSEDFVKSIVVNTSGKRFIPEDAYLGHLGRAIVEQEGKKAWLILDAKTYWSAYKDVIPRFGQEGYLEFRGPLLINLLLNTTRGGTLDKLANKIGVDAQGLTQQVKQYNSDVRSGSDPLQKKLANCRPLREGAYYAIDISVSNRRCMCPIIPMGGLRVDEDNGQVLRKDNSGIEGLFAAGRAAVGIPSGFYVSGSSLADCVFSGRRAGASAAIKVET